MAVSPAIDTAYVVTLYGGTPWGFRLEGGSETQEPIRVSKVNPNSKSFREGVKVGHVVCRINGEVTWGLSLLDAQTLVKQAGNTLELELKRSEDVGAVADKSQSAKPTSPTKHKPTTSPTKHKPAQSPGTPSSSSAITPTSHPPSHAALAASSSHQTSALVHSPTDRSHDEMLRSSARIQLSSGFTSQDEETMSETVRRRPKMNIITNSKVTPLKIVRPEPVTQSSGGPTTPHNDTPHPMQHQSGGPTTPHADTPYFMQQSGSPISQNNCIMPSFPTVIRSRKRSPGTPVKIGSSADHRLPERPSSALDFPIENRVSRARLESKERPSSALSQPLYCADRMYGLSTRGQHVAGTPPKSPPLGVKYERGRFITRSPSPRRSTWRAQASTQALDDQVAQITRELEALANNMDRIIFTPVARACHVTRAHSPRTQSPTRAQVFSPPPRDLSPDFGSPPRIFSPPVAGTTSKTYRPVAFTPTRQDSQRSEGQRSDSQRSDSQRSEGHQYSGRHRAESPSGLSVASSGMTINVDSLLARVEADRSRGHQMFLRQKQKLRESEDEFQMQQLHQDRQDYSMQEPWQQEPGREPPAVQSPVPWQHQQQQQQQQQQPARHPPAVMPKPANRAVQRIVPSSPQGRAPAPRFSPQRSLSPTPRFDANTPRLVPSSPRFGGNTSPQMVPSQIVPSSPRFGGNTSPQMVPSQIVPSSPRFGGNTSPQMVPSQIVPSSPRFGGNTPQLIASSPQTVVSKLQLRPGTPIEGGVDDHPAPPVRQSIQVINRASSPTKPAHRLVSNTSPRPYTPTAPDRSASVTPVNAPHAPPSGLSKPGWVRTEEVRQNVGMVEVRSVSPAPAAFRDTPGPRAIQLQSSVTSPSKDPESGLSNGETRHDHINGLVNGHKSGRWSPENDDLLSEIEQTTRRIQQTSTELGPPPYTLNKKQFKSVNLDNNNTDVIIKSEVADKSASVTRKNDVNAQMNGHIVASSTSDSNKLHLPKTQSPAVTLLQKYREGSLPRGAVYVGAQDSVDGDVKTRDTFYLLPGETTVTSQTIEKKAPRYNGIGPTESKTGVPTGLRSTIDEKNQKDWYKEFYKTLHVAEKAKDEIDVILGGFDTEVNTYRPTYTFPEPEPESEKEEEENPYVPSYALPSPGRSRGVSESHSVEDDSTLTRTRVHNSEMVQRSQSWAPAHAKARIEKYRNQPNKIEDYEPGKSSIALQEKRTELGDESQSTLYNPPIEKPNSQYTISEREAHMTKSLQSPPIDPAQQHKWYKQVQKGGEIPLSGFRKSVPERKDDPDDVFVTDYRPKTAAERLGVKTPPPFNMKGVKPAPHHHFSTSDLPRTSPSVEGPQDRRRRDEEDARRKHYLNILNEENKRKRGEEERRSLEQRRHNDYFLPKQKSPIPEDRFDGLLPPRLDKKHKPLEIRGKARAVYSFKAQNVKELSFRKNDVIYLLRRIDNNWYEAERHGMRGIVPVNYIEVVKSIEEAHNLAQKAEGTAAVKFKFRKQNPIELDADKGDVVRLVRRVDDNWYEARLNNKQGIIPASYLNVNNEPDTPFITPAPSVIGSVIHSTVTTPGPGTPVRPLSPLVPDPLSPPEWDFTKFYLPGMPVQREPSRDTSRDNTLRKHHTLPRDFISPEVVQRDFTSPPRNRYHSESSLGAGNDESRDSRYSTLDSRRVPGDEYGRPEYGARVQDTRRHDYHDVMEARGDEPLKAYRVLFNYIPQNDDELDIREGDHVYVLERCDDGWFVGTSTRTGQFGTFPGNYVQPV